jgi:mannobiose 2-epimerase
MVQPVAESPLRRQLYAELTENILPFWMRHPVDRVDGGFYGAVTNDLQVRNDVPRSAILCARILWTFATAYRRLGADEYLKLARWALEYLTDVFWDLEHGGLYWEVDAQGNPVSDRKHHYAQAFGIYGLSEYHRATRDSRSLELARELFELLEEHAFDPAYQGYTEGSSREWGPLADMRLSDKEPNCHKSMNTLLHLLEAYTNLLRVWEDARLKARLVSLVEAFQQHIVDHNTGHLKLFFDRQWQSLVAETSFGHDIEASWLLVEAAELLSDPALLARAREAALKLAAAVYREGLDDDGSLRSEGGAVDTGKAWWVQAEAVVGFYNAFQLSGRFEFAQAAYRCWEFIQTRLIDREHGDWFKQLRPDGRPDEAVFKVGPWECPYHHSRLCLEMLDRMGS